MTRDTPPDADDDPPGDAAATDGARRARERALQAREEPYARATVVRREPPVSATVGDRALVTADGDLDGWIGGVSCAQSRVTDEAQAAIADGEPRLIGIAPDPDAIDRPGLEAFPMQCHSQGTLEVFIEPVLPARRLLVVGGSPIAHSLVRLATELDVDVTLVDPEVEENAAELPADTTVLPTLEPEEIAAAGGRGPFVVVASMGEYDARGVAAGVIAEAPYIGLVASETRAAEIADRAAGLLECEPAAVRDVITSPAGIDISASTAPEIATSLLAELVAVRATTGAATASSAGVAAAVGSQGIETAGTADESDTEHDDSSDDATATTSCCSGESEDEATAADETAAAIDPVCEMTVDPDEAPHVTHQGTTYYFCCHGCADAFRTDPDEYLEGIEHEQMSSA
ncbi:XdhC family protein [Natronorubrum aibiense]|uniref:YHS domain-containing protein n=1 Tax=Natronorubrum aibiense TaxID=348826 RepID=A0A5P9P586_9EURY|nr:XdhC family protein [Natronorubrum aibiense]QFU83236.1 YHS domain-containing protein [Natronorubrum aibiense]